MARIEKTGRLKEEYPGSFHPYCDIGQRSICADSDCFSAVGPIPNIFFWNRSFPAACMGIWKACGDFFTIACMVFIVFSQNKSPVCTLSDTKGQKKTAAREVLHLKTVFGRRQLGEEAEPEKSIVFY